MTSRRMLRTTLALASAMTLAVPLTAGAQAGQGAGPGPAPQGAGAPPAGAQGGQFEGGSVKIGGAYSGSLNSS